MVKVTTEGDVVLTRLFYIGTWEWCGDELMNLLLNNGSSDHGRPKGIRIVDIILTLAVIFS